MTLQLLLTFAALAAAQNAPSERTLEALKAWGAQESVAAPQASPKPVVKPVTDRELNDALRWGDAHLVAHQWSDGSWGVNRHQAFGTPNSLHVRNAITAIVLDALERRPPDKEGRLARAIEKGREYLLKNGLSKANPGETTLGGVYANDEVYSLAFGLSWLLRQGKIADKAARVKQYLEQIDAEEKAGLYYGFNKKGQPMSDTSATFHVAPLLLAVCQAETAGYAPPKGLKKRLRARTSFGYYSGEGSKGDNSESAVGRFAATRLAVIAADGVKYGEYTQSWFYKPIEVFLKNREALAKHLDKIWPTHTGPYDWAPYYYLFGLRHTVLLLKALPREKAKEPAQELARSLIDMQETGGGWQDSGYAAGRSYGTAFAMLSLMDAAEILEIKVK